MSTGAGLVNRRYQPHQVFAYTISGKWGYLEHDWVAPRVDFIYEPPGEAHTLVTYESGEPMRVFFVVQGAAYLARRERRQYRPFRRTRPYCGRSRALQHIADRGCLCRHFVSLSGIVGRGCCARLRCG